MAYTTIGLSIYLGLSLVLVHTTKIYMDEGGVRYYYGSFVMKQAGGYAYLALAVLSTLLIVAKKATNKIKNRNRRQYKYNGKIIKRVLIQECSFFDVQI